MNAKMFRRLLGDHDFERRAEMLARIEVAESALSTATTAILVTSDKTLSRPVSRETVDVDGARRSLRRAHEAIAEVLLALGRR